MGKWDKLNNELDSLLDSLTKEDWIKWDSQREAKSEQRKMANNQMSFNRQKYYSEKITSNTANSKKQI